MAVNRREKILEVAKRLFAAKGFDGTSIRNIAKDSGLSVAGMFHYFSSKEEILNEIITEFVDSGYDGLEAIRKRDRPPLEKMEEICKFYVHHLAGNKNELTILVSESKSLSLEHRKIFYKKQEIYIDSLKGLMQELETERQLIPVKHSVLTLLFFGMVNWTYFWYNKKGEIGLDDLETIITEIFLRGILKESQATNHRSL
jgi:AcrR family transcriptional regulator